MFDNRPHAVAKPAQAVFHAGRYFREYRARQQAVFFHGAQVICQYFLADAFQASMQFAKAFCTAKHIPQDEQFPLVADQSNRCCHRTGRQVFFDNHYSSEACEVMLHTAMDAARPAQYTTPKYRLQSADFVQKKFSSPTCWIHTILT
jgi:hypothetical protein